MATIMYIVEEVFKGSLTPLPSVLYEGTDLQEAFSVKPRYDFTLVTICGYEGDELVSHWRLIRKSKREFTFGEEDMEPWWENDSEFVLDLQRKRDQIDKG